MKMSMIWKIIAALATFASLARGAGVQLALPPPTSLTYEQYDGMLEQQIRANPVMMYTGATCGNSRASKNLFDTKYPTLRYAYLDYDRVSGGEWLMYSSVKKSGSMKLPQVYLCGQYIGGKPALFDMDTKGDLVKWLRSCAGYTL